MSRYWGLLLVAGLASCLEASGFKGVSDSGQEVAGDGLDLVTGEEAVEEGWADEGARPEEVSEVLDAEEAGPDDGVAVEVEEGLEGEGPDEGPWEVVDAGACLKDEDCQEVLGPLGPCEVALCLDGQCTSGQAPAGTACAGDGNPCTVDQCNESGQCVHDPITCLNPPENHCDGDTLVTYASPGSCDRGQCEYAKTEKVCAQGCTASEGVAHCVGEDSCEGVTCEDAPAVCLKVPGTCEKGSCVFEYDDGATCDDGDACTDDDRCAQGVCWGEPMVCDDPPEPFCQDASTLVTFGWPGTCEEGKCNYPETAVQCLHGCEVGRDGVARCVDQDPCEVLDCSEAPSPCFKAPGACVDGACVYEYADGAACEDGDLCTLGDHCEGGQCLSGAPKVCDDQDVCTDDRCDPESGECQFPVNQAPCDDNSKCTTGDRCVDGVCRGSPVECNTPPPPECVDFQHVKVWDSAGRCDEDTGECVYGFTQTACDSGWCQYGYCTSEGMTVVGFFEAGGGVLEGDGLSLGGTFGGWTEGTLCEDGVFVLHAGW